ncbi:MAG: hypothetical protein WA830_13945 [Candidatus Sulfotelmatobacter sp.]
MKLHRIVCLGAVLVIPQLLLAKLPATNDSFGKMEGILDFCAQADSQSASKYQERKKVLAGDATEKEIAEARETQEYKDGYQAVSDELGKVPKEKAVKACTAYLEGK